MKGTIMQENTTTAETQIGSYRVIIDNVGCLHIHMAGFQLYLKKGETHRLLAFLTGNSTENAEESSAPENDNL
jgi:hypothetical protein